MVIEMVETGDSTYPERVKRYEYIVARRADKPRPSLQKIAEELGISRQNVHRILRRGTVKPSGRPRSNDGRRKRVAARLTKWHQRRLDKTVRGLDTSYEDGWISRLEAELRSLA